MRLRLDGLTELLATAARALPFGPDSLLPYSAPLTTAFFLNYLPCPCLDLASHVPPVATVAHSCTPLCPNSDPSPLAHPYPFIFYPLLLSPVVFHNNTPLPFLPPPPTARQAYLIPQPRCNQPTSLLVPQINNTVRHTHTFSNPPPNRDFSFPFHWSNYTSLKYLPYAFYCTTPQTNILSVTLQ